MQQRRHQSTLLKIAWVVLFVSAFTPEARYLPFTDWFTPLGAMGWEPILLILVGWLAELR
jgi:hypothetical protein